MCDWSWTQHQCLRHTNLTNTAFHWLTPDVREHVQMVQNVSLVFLADFCFLTQLLPAKWMKKTNVIEPSSLFWSIDAGCDFPNRGTLIICLFPTIPKMPDQTWNKGFGMTHPTILPHIWRHHLEPFWKPPCWHSSTSLPTPHHFLLSCSGPSSLSNCCSYFSFVCTAHKQCSLRPWAHCLPSILLFLFFIFVFIALALLTLWTIIVGTASLLDSRLFVIIVAAAFILIAVSVNLITEIFVPSAINVLALLDLAFCNNQNYLHSRVKDGFGSCVMWKMWKNNRKCGTTGSGWAQ